MNNVSELAHNLAVIKVRNKHGLSLTKTAADEGMLAGALSGIQNLWNQHAPADPQARQALLYSLIGAGGGGAAGTLVNLLTARKKKPFSSFLTGAALGGLGGASAGWLSANPGQDVGRPVNDTPQSLGQINERIREIERRQHWENIARDAVGSAGEVTRDVVGTVGQNPVLGAMAGLAAADPLLATARSRTSGYRQGLLDIHNRLKGSQDLLSSGGNILSSHPHSRDLRAGAASTTLQNSYNELPRLSRYNRYWTGGYGTTPAEMAPVLDQTRGGLDPRNFRPRLPPRLLMQALPYLGSEAFRGIRNSRQ